MPVNITIEFVQSLMNQVSQQANQIAELNNTIEVLTQTIKSLEEKLNKNSSNSSKPPSSDGLKKTTRDRSLREKGKNKQGGQPGHEGTRMVITGKPDTIVDVIPNNCQKCPCWKQCKGTACISEKRYKVDIEIHQTLEEYDCYNVKCPKTNTVFKGNFPDNIKGEIQYGENIGAMIVTFNTLGAVSAKRVKEILGEVFNLPISTGTVCKMVHRCAEKVEQTVNKIKDEVTNLDVVHFDETGTRVNGKTTWVHVACNNKYTCLHYGKRGIEGMADMGILPNFDGIAIHDCWKSYWSFDVSHGLCNAHLLRELNGVIQNHPEQEWAEDFKRLLLEMKKVKDKAVLKEKDEISYYYAHKFNKNYDEIIKKAHSENPLPKKKKGQRGRPKKGKVLALIERLEKYKGEVCLFIKDFSVPFDNNQAERDIRMVKTKTKVSGCFRTEEGIKDYLAIMSYVSTARKNGINAVKAIKEAFKNNSDFLFE